MKNVKKMNKLATIAMLGAFPLVSVTLNAATPLLEFSFNETGSTASSSGSASASAVLWNSSYSPTDLHGASGSGVSGGPGDRAFDNSASTGMGNAGTGGMLYVGDLDAVDGLKSFTLQGWFKSSVAINGVARLFDKNSGSGNAGFQLRSTATAGQLLLQVNSASVTSSAAYGATNEWVFFAVTFDGTSTTDNVKFYVGSQASEVSLVTTASIGATMANPNAATLVVGNSSWLLPSGPQVNNRPFDGVMDNFRIYGALSGAGGMLSLSELEGIRLNDVTPIPEPSSAIALAGLAGLSLAVCSRRRRDSR